MTGIGQKLWEIGRSPPEHLSLLVAGLVALLTGLVSTSMLAVVAPGPSRDAIAMAALFLRAVGGFFVTLSFLIGAYTATGESVTVTVWRVSQLLGAILVLTLLF